MDFIACAKSAADPVGHYSRPDVTWLMFNARPNPVVMSFSEGMGIAAEVVANGDAEEAGDAGSEPLGTECQGRKT